MFSVYVLGPVMINNKRMNNYNVSLITVLLCEHEDIKIKRCSEKKNILIKIISTHVVGGVVRLNF